METVNEVKLTAGGFEFTEALDEGIRLRRRLLERQVPPLENDDTDTEAC